MVAPLIAAAGRKVTAQAGAKAGTAEAAIEGAHKVREALRKRALASQTVLMLILPFTLPFWFLQLYCWVISLFGVGMESLWLFGSILPGEEVFLLFSLFGITLSIFLMMIALIIFKFRGVDCLGGFKVLVFGLCAALSLAPLVFFIPWVYVWCWSVVVMQSQHK